jgi:hypothetical protein
VGRCELIRVITIRTGQPRHVTTGDAGAARARGTCSTIVPAPARAQIPQRSRAVRLYALQQCHGRPWCLRRRVHVRASTRARLSDASTTIVTSTAGTQRTWSPFTT